MKVKFAVALPAAAYLLWFCVSCGSQPAPRSFRQITVQRKQLPALFLTANTRKEVILPADVVCPVVDKETGELCWRAYVCTNPSCSGKGKTSWGRPLLFIHPDPLVKVGPDGKAFYEKPPPGKEPFEYLLELGGTTYPTCPECLKIRNPESETREQMMQYAHWVEPYVLPETARRLNELDEEEQRWREQRQKRKNRRPDRDR